MATEKLMPKDVRLGQTQLEMIRENWCKYCQAESDEIVENYAGGERSCRRCCRVLETTLITEDSEWRTFGNDKDQDGPDPNRVGGANDKHQHETLLQVSIVGGSGRQAAAFHTANKQSISAVETQRREALLKLNEVRAKLNLNQAVQDRAYDLYSLALKKLNDPDSAFKNKRTISQGLVAACMIYACRQESVPRDIKDVAASAELSKKELTPALRFVRQVLPEQMSSVTSESFLGMFCHTLRLPSSLVSTASEIAHQATDQEVILGRCPTSVAAAVIYMSCLLSGVKCDRKGIAEAANVKEPTIRAAYNDLYKHRATIISAELQSRFAEGYASLPAV